MPARILIQPICYAQTGPVDLCFDMCYNRNFFHYEKGKHEWPYTFIRDVCMCLSVSDGPIERPPTHLPPLFFQNSQIFHITEMDINKNGEMLFLLSQND